MVEAIIAGIDFSGWSVLADDISGLLDDVVRDGMVAAIAQLGLGTEAKKEVMNLVNEKAEAYAMDRSAELVGLSRVGDSFVDNPNAEWRIDESTRGYLRSSVKDAISEGWSNDKLAENIEEAYGFSEERAMMIARTETNRASNTGALESYKASGVVEGKQWVTSNDDKVSDDCVENGEAGPDKDGVLMDLDADFPSGESMPPNHPNCRCAIIPVVTFGTENA